MATVTLLEKARQRRLNALANLGAHRTSRYDGNMVSIFEYAFDERADDIRLAAKNNVVAFRTTRKTHDAANDTAAPERVAA